MKRNVIFWSILTKWYALQLLITVVLPQADNGLPEPISLISPSQSPVGISAPPISLNHQPTDKLPPLPVSSYSHMNGNVIILPSNVPPNKMSHVLIRCVCDGAQATHIISHLRQQTLHGLPSLNKNPGLALTLGTQKIHLARWLWKLIYSFDPGLRGTR